MRIIWWSDYACPYCYIAEARLHKAIKDLGLENEIEYEPRAFELDPSAPATVQSDTATRFATKYRLSLAEAKAQVEHISHLGREAGLDFRYATSQYTNTFDAHRLMKMALSKNDQALSQKVNTLLFDAYFTKNLRLADHAVLLDVAKEAGMDADEVKKMLESDAFGAEVRADERAAAERGIHGVPFFIFPDGSTVPGAISEHDFRELLKRNAALQKGPAQIKGHQCGPDGCQI